MKVKTSRGSEVTKTVKTDVKGIHPGETVLITGPTAKNGTVTAESIRVGSTGGGLGSLFGGGGARSGGAQEAPAARRPRGLWTLALRQRMNRRPQRLTMKGKSMHLRHHQKAARQYRCCWSWHSPACCWRAAGAPPPIPVRPPPRPPLRRRRRHRRGRHGRDRRQRLHGRTGGARQSDPRMPAEGRHQPPRPAPGHPPAGRRRLLGGSAAARHCRRGSPAHSSRRR